MHKIYYIILISIHINFSLSYIVLPIETLKKDNFKFKYGENTPKDVIASEYYSTFFTEFKIGTISKKIPLLIKVKTNDYVITSIHPEENASDYYINKTVYDFSESFLENYNFFDENKSDTISCKYCQERKKNKYSKEVPIAEIDCPSFDYFYFYENINMKNERKVSKLYFELARNIKDNITGIVGLKLYDNYFRRESSFLYLLKQNNITKNYHWSFDFEQGNINNGKLIIGSLLDEIYYDIYDNDDLVYAESYQKNYYMMKMDKIFVLISNYEYDLGDSVIELNFDKILL